MNEKEISTVKRAQNQQVAPDSPASKETFAERTRRPGDVGLANESRPGLGSRAADDGSAPLRKTGGRPTPQDAEPLGRNAPLPPREPREQKSDPAAREQERDTEASGQSGLK